MTQSTPKLESGYVFLSLIFSGFIDQLNIRGKTLVKEA